MSRSIALVEPTVVDRATTTLVVLRYAVGPFVTAPTDTPASTPYLPQVQALGGITQAIGTDESPLGALDVSGLVLGNAPDDIGRPRPLDARLCAGDGAGWPVTIRRVPAGGSLASATAIATLVQEMPRLTRSTVTLTVRDRMGDLDTPMLTTRYAGTGGLEGGADLEGVEKERTWGRCRNVQPTYLGLSAANYPLWSLNGGQPIQAITAVRDGGVDRGAATPGTLGAADGSWWRVNLATGTLETYSKGEFDLTVDVEGDARGGAFRDTPASLIPDILVHHLGLALESDLDGTWATRAAERPWAVGLHVPAGDGMTAREAVEALCRSDRFWMAWTPAGRLTTGPLGAPSGPPSFVWRPDLHHGGVEPGDDQGLPVHEVSIGHTRNWTPGQRTAALAPTASVTFAETEYRRAVSEGAWSGAVKARCPLAGTLSLDTLLADAADAALLRGALEADRAEARREYTLDLFLDAAEVPALGAVGTVYDDVAGFEAGRRVRVVALSLAGLLNGRISVTVRD